MVIISIWIIVKLSCQENIILNTWQQCCYSDINGPFAANGHMVQNPHCWRASCILGYPKQSDLNPVKFKFSLFWISQCVASSPARCFLYHVTVSWPSDCTKFKLKGNYSTDATEKDLKGTYLSVAVLFTRRCTKLSTTFWVSTMKFLVWLFQWKFYMVLYILWYAMCI